MKITTMRVSITHERKPEYDNQRFDALEMAFMELIEEVAGAQRMNAGFEIIAAQQVSTIAEVVLGKRESDGEYVTWVCFCSNDYNWGHYFGSDQSCEAMADFLKRVKDNEEVYS